MCLRQTWTSSQYSIFYYCLNRRAHHRDHELKNERKHFFIFSNPADTRRWNNVGWMLGQRRRRWANIQPTLFQRLVPAGKAYKRKEEKARSRWCALEIMHGFFPWICTDTVAARYEFFFLHSFDVQSFSFYNKNIYFVFNLKLFNIVRILCDIPK